MLQNSFRTINFGSTSFFCSCGDFLAQLEKCLKLNDVERKTVLLLKKFFLKNNLIHRNFCIAKLEMSLKLSLKHFHSNSTCAQTTSTCSTTQAVQTLKHFTAYLLCQSILPNVCCVVLKNRQLPPGTLLLQVEMRMKLILQNGSVSLCHFHNLLTVFVSQLHLHLQQN